MANSRHYLSNQQIEEPRNWEDLEITVDWASDKLDTTISLDKLEFVGQTAIDVIARMQAGLSGGLGMFEGEPYRIEVGDPNNNPFVFNGYLDFTDNPVVKDCNIVEVALNREQGADWLEATADSFSFRYLASDSYNGLGKITNQNYVSVPYIINYVPDGMQLLILAISTFSLTKELVQSVQSLAEQSIDIIKQVVPNQGTAGPIPVVSWSTGQIVAAIVKLAVTIAYTVGIIIAIIKLVEQIVEQLAPVKRFHLGMSLKTLFQKSCDHLGLTLKSDLLDTLDEPSKRWVLIPSKNHKGGLPPTGTDAADFTEVGFPTSVDGIDTFGDLIRFAKRTFNANFRITDGVFEFERRDYWRGLNPYVIPNTFQNQAADRNEYTFNTNEIKANYVVKWSDDQSDLNTLDNPSGRVFQAVTSPKVVSNRALVNIKGLEEVTIPFSLAVRKNELTIIEEVLKVFLQAADFLTGQLGQPQSFASAFTARIGSMHISSHFLSKGKIVAMNGNTLAIGQRTILDASKLWDNYHFIESFVTINDINNQQVIYQEQKIPFCFENFVSLVNNNFVTTEDGEDAEITNLNWKVEEDFATITYRVYRVYDNNLEITTFKS
jgi:hypothetical protein